MTAEEAKSLEGMLLPRDGSGRSLLAWMREPPEAPKVSNMAKVLERLHAVRGLGIDAKRGAGIPLDRLKRIAREGRLMTAAHLADLEPLRRQATLAALALDLRATLTDDVLTLFYKLIGTLVRRADRSRKQRISDNQATLIEAAKLFLVVTDAVDAHHRTGVDPIKQLEASIRWPALLEKREAVRAMMEEVADETIPLLVEKFGAVRSFAPDFLAAFDFKAARENDPLLRAVDAVKAAHVSSKRMVSSGAPIGFLRPAWRGHVVQDGKINPRLYEIAVLAHLRERLQSGDVWVEDSRQFRAFDSYLLPEATVHVMRDEGALSLPFETDVTTYLARRAEELNAKMKETDAALAAGRVKDVEIVDGNLRIAPIRKGDEEDAAELRRLAYSVVPRTRITEVLMEADALSGFSERFVHLRSGLSVQNKAALYATILADATNLGLLRMAEASRGLTHYDLVRTAQWHVRDETYQSALVAIIDAHHVQPFSRLWGQGDTSSSDGQHFKAGGHGQARGDVNARYGDNPGVAFYTHISDQYGPFHTKVIGGTANEAPYVLDGLLNHEATLAIREHYTDTGGASDHVFALCHLLGYRFAPRIRDFNERVLFCFERPGTYPTLQPIIARQVRADLIRDNWDQVIRLVASLRARSVAPSELLRKLASFTRRNSLSEAMREIGRIERTLFSLDWYTDPGLRRRTNLGLNKGEARNSLARAVFFNRLGELRDRTYENQRHKASGLNLVVAAIILWNTVYLERATNALRAAGYDLPDGKLVHVAPLSWEHINLTGDYAWGEAGFSQVGQRPLGAIPSLMVARAA